MAKTNIYDDKKTRYVDLVSPTEATAKFTYFFKTNVDETEVTDLGQTSVTALPASLPAPAIAGTKRPTPLMVHNAKTRIRTLCSSSKFATAQTAGWRRIEQSNFCTPRTQNSSPAAGDRGAILVIVPCESLGASLNFGWFMQIQQFLKISAAEKTGLGISVPASAADWAKVVLGCNKLRPPRARRTLISGGSNTVVGGADTTETFYSVGNTLPEGWVHSSDFQPFSL